MCFVAIAAMAQNKAEIMVSYNYVFPNKNGKNQTEQMTLMASSLEAKYFSELSQWVDSMKSTIEGKAQYMDILKKACMTVDADGSIAIDLTKGPVKKTYTYVSNNPSEESLTYYDKFGDGLGCYSEPLSEIKWTIVEDSMATVIGYECIMAVSDYHGRHWKAWFAPEIPLSYGPWKLRGLPGLILRAEANGGFSFTATGLERTERPILPVYRQQEYVKVDRKKALESAEYFLNNRESIIKAQERNVEFYSVDDNGNKVETPKYDGLKHSLEPDYKMK